MCVHNIDTLSRLFCCNRARQMSGSSGRPRHLKYVLIAATIVSLKDLWSVVKRSRTDVQRFMINSICAVLITQISNAFNGILRAKAVIMVTMLIMRTDLITLWSLSISCGLSLGHHHGDNARDDVSQKDPYNDSGAPANVSNCTDLYPRILVTRKHPTSALIFPDMENLIAERSEH